MKRIETSFTKEEEKVVDRYRLTRLVNKYDFTEVLEDTGTSITVRLSKSFPIPLANPGDAYDTARFFIMKERSQYGFNRIGKEFKK